jgi:hypothetical protein
MDSNLAIEGESFGESPLLCLVKSEISEENMKAKRKKGRNSIEVEGDPEKDSRRFICAHENCNAKASVGALCSSHWKRLVSQLLRSETVEIVATE